MTLDRATVIPVVNSWALGRRPRWSMPDTDSVIASLVALSDAASPWIVADVGLSAAEIQDVLLRRTIASIETWLTRAASGLRTYSGAGLMFRTAAGALPLGLRSAPATELDGLPGVGQREAEDLARVLALDPEVNSMDDLGRVRGVGAATLARLKADAYLDQPAALLVSGSLLAFASAPSIRAYLQILDASDLEFRFGDSVGLGRRPPGGGAPVDRFLRLLAFVRSAAQVRASPASGTLASRERDQLARLALAERYRSALVPVSGQIVVNDEYRAAAIALIGSANSRLRIAHFAATASAGPAETGGSLAIIEAVEARAAAGVGVQVILDRDRPGDPYLSREINRPVVDRLRRAGIPVKQDDPATLLHSKLLVADDMSALVGSHNLTTASIATTYEVSIRVDSASVARSFGARFDALWASLA